MEAPTAVQQGMLHAVSLHTSAPHSVVGVPHSLGSYTTKVAVLLQNFCQSRIVNDSQFQLLITTVDLRIVVQIANGKSQMVNDNACEVSVCCHSI